MVTFNKRKLDILKDTIQLIMAIIREIKEKVKIKNLPLLINLKYKLLISYPISAFQSSIE